VRGLGRDVEQRELGECASAGARIVGDQLLDLRDQLVAVELSIERRTAVKSAQKASREARERRVRRPRWSVQSQPMPALE